MATVPLTVSEARLSSVLDTAGDGIVVIDEGGGILVFNKACERLFGWSAAEIAGRDIGTILAAGPQLARDGSAAIAPVRGITDVIGACREVVGRHRNGSTFPVELSVGEAPTPDGRQFIAILRDLRPRRQAEERLNELQTELLHRSRVSAVDEMGAALAHELNQPLTAAMLYLQAAEKTRAKAAAAHAASAPGAALDQALAGMLAKAMRETGRASLIIQRMRQFIEKNEPERQLADLNPLVEEALELTLVGYGRHVQVTRNLRKGLPPVLVDPVQIQQIVVNLVRNALEAVAGLDHPRIWIETQAGAGQVRLAVRDSGAGVPPEAVPHLFQAFASSKRKGLGLGLAISRTIAQNHGGDLVVDPGGGGRGAAFSLLLPDPGGRSG